MRLLKIILLSTIIISLNACSYDPTSHCIKLPQAVWCPKDKRTDIDLLEKNVSNEQKLQDFKSCGVTPDKHGNYVTSLVKKAKQDGLDDEYFYVSNVSRCMIDKGYQ